MVDERHMDPHNFSVREMDYLRSLPAVARVTPERIFYTESFKRDCVTQWMAGESPVRIFARAGLDSELIGYKRIERCMSRWRSNYLNDILRDSTRHTGTAGVSPSEADLQQSGQNAGSNPAIHPAEPPSLPQRTDGGPRQHTWPMVIAQQAHYIDMLEHQIARLTEELDLLRNPGVGSSGSDNTSNTGGAGGGAGSSDSQS